MKKLITLLVFAALLQLAQAEYGGGVTTTQLSAQLATKLNASAVEQTVSSSTTNVPSSAAVSNALAALVVATVTNPVVPTVAAGTSSNVISGAGVVYALSGKVDLNAVGSPENFTPSFKTDDYCYAPLIMGTMKDITTPDVVSNYYGMGGMCWDAQHGRWVVSAHSGTGHDVADSDVALFYSTDSMGTNWSAPKIILAHSNGVYRWKDNRIFQFGNSLMLMATRYGVATTGDGEIFFYQSLDGGTTWNLYSEIDGTAGTTNNVAWNRIASTTKPVFWNGEWLLAAFETDWSASPAYNLRVVIKSSNDGMKTWATKGFIDPTGTNKLNETGLFPYQGNLVALCRVESTGPSALIRFTSSNATDWVSAGATFPTNISQARPEILTTADGRVLLCGRDVQAVNGGALWETKDGGATWNKDTCFSTKYSVYQAIQKMDDAGIYGMVNFRASTNLQGVAVNSAWPQYSVFDFGKRPIKNMDSVVLRSDSFALAWKASNLNATSFPARVGFTGYAASGEEPTVISAGASSFYGAAVLDFPSNGNDRITFGTTNDWKFLHNGSPWTIGILYNYKNRASGAINSLFGTMAGSGGNTGILFRISGQRVQLYVLNGAAAAHPCSGASSEFPFTGNREWENIVLRYDGTNYWCNVNGQWSQDAYNTTFPFAPTNAFPTGVSSQPLWIGHASGTGNQCAVRSMFVTTNALTGYDLWQAQRWLESE
jgi:hypothetical protein